MVYFEQDLGLAQVALNIRRLMSTNASSKPTFCNHLIIGSLHCLFFCVTSPALFFWVVLVPTSICALKSPPMTIFIFGLLLATSSVIHCCSFFCTCLSLGGKYTTHITNIVLLNLKTTFRAYASFTII